MKHIYFLFIIMVGLVLPYPQDVEATTDPFVNPPAYFTEALGVWNQLVPKNNDSYSAQYLTGQLISMASINEPLMGLLYSRERFQDTRWDTAIHFMAADYATRLLSGSQPASWNLWAAGLSEYVRIFQNQFPTKTAHVADAIRFYSQHGVWATGGLWTWWFPGRAREAMEAMGWRTTEEALGPPFAPGYDTGSPGGDGEPGTSKKGGWASLGGGRKTRTALLLDMLTIEPKTLGNWSALDTHGHFHHWFDNSIPMLQPNSVTHPGRYYVHTLYVAYWANYLLRHYRLIDQDPRIKASIVAAANWMINHAWLGPKDPDNPTTEERNATVTIDDHGTIKTVSAFPWHFAYDVEFESDALTPKPRNIQAMLAITGAPNVWPQWSELSMLHAGWIAAAYQFTGNIKYLKFADALFSGWAKRYKKSAQNGLNIGVKQWAQASEWAREYFEIYRQPSSSLSIDTTPPSPPMGLVVQ